MVVHAQYEQTIGYAGLRLSADDFSGLPDDGNRYELIEGAVTIPPSSSASHQRVTGLNFRLPGAYVEANRLGECFFEIDVFFGRSAEGRDIIYRPDVICYLGPASRAEGQRLRLIPAVVVEIVSPESLNRDSLTKRHDYARFGVAEYWLINPADRKFSFFHMTPDGFIQAPCIADVYASAAIPGFRLDLRAVRSAYGVID